MLELKNFSLQSIAGELIFIDELSLESNKHLLVGKNESGKSLLCRTLFEHYRDYTGEICFQDQLYPVKKQKSPVLYVEIESHLLLNDSLEANILLPFVKVSERITKKMEELLILTGLNDFKEQPAAVLSFSQQKLVELIRAVLQFPGMLLIDDFDLYFDERTQVKALAILDLVIENGGLVIATSKHRISDFKKTFIIHNKKLVRV